MLEYAVLTHSAARITDPAAPFAVVGNLNSPANRALLSFHLRPQPMHKVLGHHMIWKYFDRSCASL